MNLVEEIPQGLFLRLNQSKQRIFRTNRRFSGVSVMMAKSNFTAPKRSNWAWPGTKNAALYRFGIPRRFDILRRCLLGNTLSGLKKKKQRKVLVQKVCTKPNFRQLISFFPRLQKRDKPLKYRHIFFFKKSYPQN